MSWDKGFNFRATSGFITDGVNETYVLSDSYPTTRNGVTFGVTTGSVGTRDRDNSYDRRLVGVDFGFTGAIFQIDLPAAGTYDFHIAIGDDGNGEADNNFTIRDTASTKITLGPFNVGGSHFFDALGGEYHSSVFFASEAPASITFATTVLNVYCEASSNADMIAHIRVVQTGAGPTFIAGMPRMVRQAINRASTF